jgi:hypothetical protein
MNSFSHALAFFDDPYFAAGACVPDWLTACDRRCRARKKRAANWVDDDDPVMRSVARGVVQHHEDDYWFHGSAEFTRMNMLMAVEYREKFGNTQTMRASLIGHIVIEMLLDAWLESKFPGAMEAMYVWLAKLDAEKIQSSINQFATKPTDKLAAEIGRFLKVRYLFDYLKDGGVRYRMNKVLGRLQLDLMPEESIKWIGKKRELIYASAPALLKGHAKLVL